MRSILRFSFNAIPYIGSTNSRGKVPLRVNRSLSPDNYLRSTPDARSILKRILIRTLPEVTVNIFRGGLYGAGKTAS